MIGAILKDISKTYTAAGGGGITDIKLVATNTYKVSIAQEERVDIINYVLTFKKKNEVVISKRTTDTWSPKK